MIQGSYVPNAFICTVIMFVNDNTILYSLSRLIRARFAAVASKYGTLSLAQSVSNIKQVVWNSFITNIRF